MNIDPDSCGASSPLQEARNRNAAIQRAIASWQAATVPGSSFPWGESTANDLFQADEVPSTSDNYNTITFRVLPGTLSGDAAITPFRISPDTLRTCHGCPGPYFFQEADIIVNSTYAATRGSADTFPADRDSAYENADVEGVVRHELGHVVGLYQEEWNEIAVMTAKYSFGGGEPFRLHADDRNGLRTYYPDAFGAERDLALCGWKLNTVGRMVPVNDPWPSDVPVGGVIEAEYMVENMGTDQITGAQVGYYLSHDPVIQPSDSLILSESYGILPPAAVGGYGVRPWQPDYPFLDIPCNIPTGNYYLGVIISAEGDTIASNNSLVFPNASAPKSIHISPATSGPCAGTYSPPGQPTNLRISSDKCYIRLDWDPPLPGGGSFNRYMICRTYYRDNGTDFLSGCLFVDGNTRSFTDLEPSLHEWDLNHADYKVYAYSTLALETGHTPWGPYVEGTGHTTPTDVTAPSNIVPTFNRCGKVVVNWSWGPGDPDSFRIDWLNGGVTVRGDQRSASIVLSPGYYSFGVKAAKGCYSRYSTRVTGRSVGVSPITYRIASNVGGCLVKENGSNVTLGSGGIAVACTTCTPGATRFLSVAATQTVAGNRYCFDSWGDGGRRTHTVSLTSDSTLTLNLVASGSGPTGPRCPG